MIKCPYCKSQQTQQTHDSEGNFQYLECNECGEYFCVEVDKKEIVYYDDEGCMIEVPS